MKKFYSLFFLLVLITYFNLSYTQKVFAQENNPSQSASLDYSLPYPGILPDNPLYVFKTLRDKLVSFFISDPLKKAQFDLLTADKRLSSAISLVDEEKKYVLAEITISKGENYFEDGLENIKMAKKEGRPLDPGLLTNMELSAKKYNQIINQMSEKTDRTLKEKFLKDSERMTDFLKEVMSLKPQ